MPGSACFDFLDVLVNESPGWRKFLENTGQGTKCVPSVPGDPRQTQDIKLSIGFFLSFDNIDKKEKNLVKIDLSDKIR